MRVWEGANFNSDQDFVRKVALPRGRMRAIARYRKAESERSDRAGIDWPELNLDQRIESPLGFIRNVTSPSRKKS